MTAETLDQISLALVDDDAAVLDSLQIYLGKHGVRVTAFSAAQDLLD